MREVLVRALFDLFDSHQRKENHIILPLLVDADAVSLTHVMADSHDHAQAHDSHEHDH